MFKYNVGVIGTGIGSCAAIEGLYQQSAIDMTVFESSKRTGGHAYSAYLVKENGKLKLLEQIPPEGVPYAPIELLAEFIGPSDAYPDVHIMSKRNGVNPVPFQQSTTMLYKGTNEKVVMPPVHATGKGSDVASNRCATSFFSKCCASESQPNVQIHQESLLKNIRELIFTGLILNDNHDEVISSSKVQTLETFGNKFIAAGGVRPFINDRRDYIARYLTPLTGSCWGITTDQARTMCVHYALLYANMGLNWFALKQGMHANIDSIIKKALGSGHTTLRTETEINAIIQKVDPETGRITYQLETNDGSLAENGKEFDALTLGPNAEILVKLFSKMRSTDKDVEQLCQKLEKVFYYDTEIWFHNDPAFIPATKTVVTVRYDNQQRAATTIYKPLNWGNKAVADDDVSDTLLKTWVFPDQVASDKPNEAYVFHRSKARHPLMNIDYYNAQVAIKEFMANRPELKLSMTNIIAGNNDSHNSAARAGFKAAALTLKALELPLTEVVEAHNLRKGTGNFESLNVNCLDISDTPLAQEKTLCCC